nr:uncharacterized protein [uncultured bacterium]
MTRSPEEIQVWLDNYAAIETQVIRTALSSCVSLQNNSGENQTGFVINQNGQKYIATLTNHSTAIAGIANAKNFSGTTFPVTLKGSSGYLALYQASAVNSLSDFKWYNDPVEEGLAVYTVGDQTDTFYTLTASYSNKDLDFSVAEGFVARVNSPLAPSWGSSITDVGPYIRHTAITNPLRNSYNRGGSFGGPLFTIKKDDAGIRYPALIGMNFYTYYTETLDPTYIGISFAISQKDLQQAITNIVG